MGKQSLENKIIEETSYLIEEIRQKNGEAFNASASNVTLLISNVFGKNLKKQNLIVFNSYKTLAALIDPQEMYSYKIGHKTKLLVFIKFNFCL